MSAQHQSARPLGHTDSLCFVALTYAPHAGRLLDPGQRFLCTAEDGRELERNGWALADPTVPGVRVVASWWHEAVVGFDLEGQRHHAGQRFVCSPAAGEALTRAGQAVRLPWLPPLTERQVLPASMPESLPTRRPRSAAFGASYRGFESDSSIVLPGAFGPAPPPGTRQPPPIRAAVVKR